MKGRIASTGLLGLVSLIVLLVLAVCAPATEGPARSKASTQTGDPADLARILPGFQRYAEQAMAAWGVPGLALAVVSQGDTVLLKGLGVRAKGGRQPVDGRTVFQIGSMSKAFTAALMGQLVDEGRLGWQDKVAERLPGFAMARPWVGQEMMIWDLMAQHLGLETQAASTLPLFGFGREAVIAALAKLEPVTSFRAEYAYQNAPFLVAGKIIENLRGTSWAQAVTDQIFKPLGMADTTADLAGFRGSANRVKLHRRAGGEAAGPVKALGEDWPFHPWVYTFGPAGGINSSARDMAAWLKLQIGRGAFKDFRLLKEETAAFIHSPKTIMKADPFSERMYYCLGWVLAEDDAEPIVWHTGGTLGCSTIIAYAPKSKVGLVVLTNLAQNNLPLALARRFFDDFFGRPQKDWSRMMLDRRDKALAAQPHQEKPASPQPPLNLNRYLGRYTNPVYGEIQVIRDSGSLAAVIGPDKVKIPLKHWDRDTFRASLPGLMDDFGFAAFTISPTGWAGEVLFDTLDRGKAGRFIRLSKDQDKKK